MTRHEFDIFIDDAASHVLLRHAHGFSDILIFVKKVVKQSFRLVV